MTTNNRKTRTVTDGLNQLVALQGWNTKNDKVGAIVNVAAAQAWIRRHKNDDPKDRHLCVDTVKEDADRWVSQYKAGVAWLEPLVSLDELAKQWEAAHGFDKDGVAKWMRSTVQIEQRPRAADDGAS